MVQTQAIKLDLIDLGSSDYRDAWKLQKDLFGSIIQQKIARKAKGEGSIDSGYLMLCEHRPVFTIGKSGNKFNMLVTEELLGAELVQIERGGDITFHGPGQLVVYPILDLEQFEMGAARYIDRLEQSVIDLLSIYQLKGKRIERASGVWLEPKANKPERKLCAVGVKLSRWVSMHGIALNVSTDLSWFDKIVPCGISNKGVSSIEAELGKAVDMTTIKAQFLKTFSANFNGCGFSECAAPRGTKT